MSRGPPRRLLRCGSRGTGGSRRLGLPTRAASAGRVALPLGGALAYSRRMRGLSAAAMCVGVLLLPSAAAALNAPVLTAVGHQDRHPTASWTLPPNVEAWAVMVATKPDQASDGQFFSENVVVADSLRTTQQTDTFWLYEERLDPGTYYVLVRGYDNACSVGQGECGSVTSNVMQLVIPAPPRPRQVARIGKGIGRWRIGRGYRSTPELIRSVRYPRNASPGCLLGPWDATRIDYYPGMRVSWTRDFLFNVATTRAGDVAWDGFAVGKARLSQVRGRYRKARVFDYRRVGNQSRYTRFNLGTRSLSVTRRTGYESWSALTYWFDRSGVLRALESSVGGC